MLVTKIVINEFDKFQKYYIESKNDNFSECGFMCGFKIIKVHNSIDNGYEDLSIEGCHIEEFYFLMNDREVILLPILSQSNWKFEPFAETVHIDIGNYLDENNWINNMIKNVNESLIDYGLTVRKETRMLE